VTQTFIAALAGEPFRLAKFPEMDGPAPYDATRNNTARSGVRCVRFTVGLAMLFAVLSQDSCGGPEWVEPRRRMQADQEVMARNIPPPSRGGQHD
jgi:hypothetical protein